MPQLEIGSIVLALVAGLACGFLNTAASSGSAVSLPILMLLGLDPITANATNRIPVLIGGITAALSFHAKKLIPWSVAAKVAVPAALGAPVGAVLAQIIPARQLGFVITAAMLAALILLFTKLKKVIENAETLEAPRLTVREMAFLFLIGIWCGFIVLDGATYLLLTLTLLVGLNLTQANAVKSVVTVAVTAVAMVIFAFRADVNWSVGALMGVGSVVGGLIGARVATSPLSKKIIFPLLVGVITLELLHLLWQFAFVNGA